MRIYISGKISGLPYKEVEAKFDDAETFLSEIGFEVVNPLRNGLALNEEWIKHLCKDLAMLYTCDAIYMLDDWRESKGACIEYHLSVCLGKKILFSKEMERNINTVLKVENSVHEVTGLLLREYNTRDKRRDHFFARMLFAYHCRRCGMKLEEISKHINREKSSMLHILNKYHDEVRYNEHFRSMAERVNKILNKTSN